MAETIERKCFECKENLSIKRNNISGVVLCKGKYYHEKCFCQMCERKAAKKSSLPFWQEALNNVAKYKNDAVEKSKHQFAKDDLNEWLLSHYNVMALPDRFWNIVADLENGIYNKKKCKPVNTVLLYETWRWGQKNLDAINRKNRQNKKGPQNDGDRLHYDLAIIMKHIPDYLKTQAKRDAEEAERKAREKEFVKIDYKNISNIPQQQEGLDDISGLLDEF